MKNLKFDPAVHRSRQGLRELAANELDWVSGGDDAGDSCSAAACASDSGIGSDSGGIPTLGEVTVTATAEPDTGGSSGNPMDLIAPGLGLLGATIGIVVATTSLGVGLATIAATAAIMNAVVNNNASMPSVPQWGAPTADIPSGP
ncbi:MAG: hypothetical protein WKG52_19105 [Variovorax sp.]